MIATISIHELHERFKNLGQNEIILDVRTPQEHAAGHIPGAKNISHEEVLQHLGELKKFDKIYVHCRSGGRVQMACYDLVNAGLKNLVAVVDGGMPEWETCGFPVER